MIVDTNALSAWAEGKPQILNPLHNAEALVIPTIVLGEYHFGIRQSRHRARYESWLRKHLPNIKIATITTATAENYASIRLELKEAGTPIPVNDTWIAALVRQHSLPLLSHDTHFDEVEGIERIDF